MVLVFFFSYSFLTIRVAPVGWSVLLRRDRPRPRTCNVRIRKKKEQTRYVAVVVPIAVAEDINPVRRDLRPDRAAPLTNWLVYHQSFLLEQALGPSALVIGYRLHWENGRLLGC